MPVEIKQELRDKTFFPRRYEKRRLVEEPTFEEIDFGEKETFSRMFDDFGHVIMGPYLESDQSRIMFWLVTPYQVKVKKSEHDWTIKPNMGPGNDGAFAGKKIASFFVDLTNDNPEISLTNKNGGRLTFTLTQDSEVVLSEEHSRSSESLESHAI